MEQQSKVRVHCESETCGALLEVIIPLNHPPAMPLVVRCGNCHKLLELFINRVNIMQQHLAQQQRIQVRQAPHEQLITKPLPDEKPHSASSFHTNFFQQHQPQQRQQDPSFKVFGESDTSQELFDFNIHKLPKPAPLTRARLMDTTGKIKNEYPLNYHEPRDHSLHHAYMESLRMTQSGRVKKERKIRHPSPYNRFMSEEVKRIKTLHPSMDHRVAFKQAASNWAKSPYECRKYFKPLAQDKEKSEERDILQSAAAQKHVLIREQIVGGLESREPSMLLSAGGSVGSGGGGGGGGGGRSWIPENIAEHNINMGTGAQQPSKNFTFDINRAINPTPSQSFKFIDHISHTTSEPLLYQTFSIGYMSSSREERELNWGALHHPISTPSLQLIPPSVVQGSIASDNVVIGGGGGSGGGESGSGHVRRTGDYYMLIDQPISEAQTSSELMDIEKVPYYSGASSMAPGSSNTSNQL